MDNIGGKKMKEATISTVVAKMKSAVDSFEASRGLKRIVIEGATLDVKGFIKDNGGYLVTEGYERWCKSAGETCNCYSHSPGQDWSEFAVPAEWMSIDLDITQYLDLKGDRECKVIRLAIGDKAVVETQLRHFASTAHVVGLSAYVQMILEETNACDNCKNPLSYNPVENPTNLCPDCFGKFGGEYCERGEK
jgi:hypothetical protein